MYDENWTPTNQGHEETVEEVVHRIMEHDDINKDYKTKSEVIKDAPQRGTAVNHPFHYNQGGIECIDAIKAATANLTGEEAFCTGNALKYLWRWKEKNGIEDLDKAIWYINRIKTSFYMDKH